MALDTKLSTLVENQFPEFYKEEGPKFLAFVKAYYQYLETTGKQQDVQRNLQSYKDIDTTLDEYIKYFRSELMAEIPNDAFADKRLLAKRIKDLYTTKGTIDSYKLLFKILYDEDVEVNFPADQMLKVSDGDFRIDRYLVTHHDPKAFTLIGKTIKGTDSQAEALVEDVKRIVARGRDIDQILLSNVKGTFNHLETIKRTDVEDGHTPIVECGIRRVTIATGGGEYRKGDIVDLISDKKGAFAKAVVVDTSDLQSKVNFNIVDGGSGYISTEEDQGTVLEFIGGASEAPASFKILSGDLTDTFAISLCTNKFGSNTIFGSTSPIVTYADNTTGIMNTHANTLLSSPDFGFRESSQGLTSGVDFRTNANAVVVIASGSDPAIEVGDSLFGVTSSANATVVGIRRAYNSTNVILAVDTFKDFQENETVKKQTPTGTTVGTIPGTSDVTGTQANPTVNSGDALSINGTTVTFTGTSVVTGSETNPTVNAGDELTINSTTVTFTGTATTTGSQTNPTVNAGDVFSINGTNVTITGTATVTGTTSNPTVTASDEFSINGNTITLLSTTLSSVIADINNASIAGIIASNDGNDNLRIVGQGVNIVLANVTNTPLADLGLTAGTTTATGDLTSLLSNISSASVSNVTATNSGNKLRLTSSANIVLANVTNTPLTNLGLSVGTTTSTGNLTSILSDISGASISNVTATNSSNALRLTGTNVSIVLANATNTPLADLGLTAGTTTATADLTSIVSQITNESITNLTASNNSNKLRLIGTGINLILANITNTPLASLGLTATTISASGGFFANTIGHHVLKVANTDGGGGISQGDELVGVKTGASGVVKKIIDITATEQYDHDGDSTPDRKIVTMLVTSNTTANVSSQFDAGPMKAFLEKEGVRKVNSSTIVGNSVFSTSNSQIENIHTSLNDSLLFVNHAVGTIARLSNRQGGQAFTKAPKVVVEHRNVAALGIGEAYLTIQFDDPNFNTGVNSIIALDTNDRLEQANGAKANIMAVGTAFQHANTTFEQVVRVWQDELQREPGGINWTIGAVATKHFSDANQSSLAGTGSVNIVKIRDEGILGENANITADVGANGSILSARVIDSGFSYKPNETITFSSSGRLNAIQGTGVITIDNIANAEGYYASTRGHVSSSRGFIQDSSFYQEFSYEVAASIALTRYRDVALRLVHPAGQRFFGKFKVSTNAMSQSVSTSLVRKRKTATGTIAINNNTNTITGTGTQFTTEFTAGQPIIIGPISDVFYQARLNSVSSDTSATIAVNWTHGNITGAKAHYFSGTVS